MRKIVTGDDEEWAGGMAYYFHRRAVAPTAAYLTLNLGTSQESVLRVTERRAADLGLTRGGRHA